MAGVLEASGADLTPDRYGGITIDLSAGNEGAARGLADAMEVRQQHGPVHAPRHLSSAFSLASLDGPCCYWP